MPTALQGFRENNRERRGVGPPCQHSRAFSASGKGLKRWPLILSPTLRSALARVSKDGHKRDRASGHPSRRSARQAARRAPQDEVFETALCQAAVDELRTWW